MNLIQKIKDFIALDEPPVVQARWGRPEDDIDERAEVLIGGGVPGGDVDGRNVNIIDQYKEVMKKYGLGSITRERALQCPTYVRAITLLSNAVAGLLASAMPEDTNKREIWMRLNDRGFSRMDNRFNFWQDAVANMLIDDFFGEIKKGILSSDMRMAKVIPRPSEVVIPHLGGEDGDMLTYQLTLGYNANGMTDERTIRYRDMLHLRRPNLRVRYTLKKYNSGGYPTVTDRLKPTPSFKDLELQIKKLYLIDRFETGYWNSPAAFKMGLLLLTADNTAGTGDDDDVDVELLQSMIAQMSYHTPLQLSGGQNMHASSAGQNIGVEAEALNVFKDYDKSIHSLREDCETVIASYFGLNPSDLGSDAARSGTGASELSESSWRNGVLPIVEACKYEIEQKLLGNKELYIPVHGYFFSPETASKMSSACVGAMSVDEYRVHVLRVPPYGDERGDQVYMGPQTGMGMAENESPNEDGLSAKNKLNVLSA